MSFLYERIAREKERESIIKNSVSNTGLIIETPEKEDDDKRYVALMNSMSHTYGNALAFGQHWIMNIFPENMFKTVHVNSQIAHKQLKNTPQEFIKKEKPMIIFRPRIPSIQEDRFMNKTSLTERQTDIYSTYGNTALQPFFDDPLNKISIKYQMNRVVMYIDVVVVLATLMQQLDYYHYIFNAVRLEKPFMVSTFMESYLPQDMLKVLGDCVNIPLYDTNGSTKEFLQYMNTHSNCPITYKLQGASQTKEFYRVYPANVLMTLSDLEKDDGDKNGSINDHYNISFTLKMEFNAAGFNYIFSKLYYKFSQSDLRLNDEIIPKFTDAFTLDELRLPIGWSMYNRGACMLDTPNDTVNIKEMLNKSIIAAIDYHNENGLPLSNFIDIRIRRQGKQINVGFDYTIDWDNYNINFIEQDQFHTYTIIICLNTEYINSLIKSIYGITDDV